MGGAPPQRRQGSWAGATAAAGCAQRWRLRTVGALDDAKDLMRENTAMTLQVKKNTDLLEEIHRHVAALGVPPAGVPDAGDDAQGQPPST
jgi:hypothetical protein